MTEHEQKVRMIKACYDKYGSVAPGDLRWALEQVEKVERYEKALQAIYNVDAYFMRDNIERPYDKKEAHDVMLETAENALWVKS